MDDFWAASVGLFIVCVIFVGFVWFVRVGLYMRRNSRPGAEFLFDANFITTIEMPREVIRCQNVRVSMSDSKITW